MKSILASVVFFLSLQAQAGLISLSSGESVTIRANSETTVTCNGNGNGGAGQIEYSFCECFDRSYQFEATMIIKYVGKAEIRNLLKTFKTNIGVCEEFLKTVPQCNR